MARFLDARDMKQEALNITSYLGLPCSDLPTGIAQAP